MEKRKEINQRLVQWIVNKVRTEYAQDVSLVLIYGSYVNGTANSKSDVDCYFIPKTERGYAFAMDFIIEGVGYDIFPMSWERVERIADLQEGLSPLVGDAVIIYAGSEAEVKRFQGMQERLKNNLSDDRLTRETAVRRCREAGRLCGTLNQSRNESETWKTAGTIMMLLADAVAVSQHDYFHYGLKKQFEDLQNKIPGIPQSIVDGYENVVEAADGDEAAECAAALLEEVCEYLGVSSTFCEALEHREGAAGEVDAPWLAALYEEICSTFNKIYVCCEAGNDKLAFLSAVCLQRDLDDAREKGCPAYELLSGFHHKGLEQLFKKTEEVERDLVGLIRRHGGRIRQYDTFEQFEAAKM